MDTGSSGGVLEAALAMFGAVVVAVIGVFVGKPRGSENDEEVRRLRRDLSNADDDLTRARQEREDMREERDHARAERDEAHAKELAAIDATARATLMRGRLERYVRRIETDLEKATNRPLSRRWSDDIEEDI